VCDETAVTNGDSCDDGVACTDPDICTDGTCGGTGVYMCLFLCIVCSDVFMWDVCCWKIWGCFMCGVVVSGALYVMMACACSVYVSGCGLPLCDDVVHLLSDSCTPSNDCNTSTCNTSTGVCDETPVANGDSCDDGVACTDPDTCTDGTCGGPTGVYMYLFFA